MARGVLSDNRFPSQCLATSFEKKEPAKVARLEQEREEGGRARDAERDGYEASLQRYQHRMQQLTSELTQLKAAASRGGVSDSGSRGGVSGMTESREDDVVNSAAYRSQAPELGGGDGRQAAGGMKPLTSEEVVVAAAGAGARAGAEGELVREKAGR